MNAKRLLIFGVVLILGFVWVLFKQSQSLQEVKLSGQTMGTIIYRITYLGDEIAGMQSGVDSVLAKFNASLSTYIGDSEISILNRSGRVRPSLPYFFPVMKTSKKVYENTDGAFDPTVGSLVNAWGFGPENRKETLDSSVVDVLMKNSGFENVVVQSDSIMMPLGFNLDFGAIAKGYAVDVVAEYLEMFDISNYLVEIGGEVRCRGMNKDKKSWLLAIEDPTVERHEQKLLATVRLKNTSLATSGNYRNYYEKNGVLHAHILDPRTGYTAQHNLLSASVFAPDCMTADAYATAFMVLGLEASILKIEELTTLDAYLVYRDADGGLKSYVSEGIKPFIEVDHAR